MKKDNSTQFLQKYLDDFDHDDRIMLLDDLDMLLHEQLSLEEFVERQPDFDGVPISEIDYHYNELFYGLMQESLVNYNKESISSTIVKTKYCINQTVYVLLSESIVTCKVEGIRVRVFKSGKSDILYDLISTYGKGVDRLESDIFSSVEDLLTHLKNNVRE